MSILTNYSCHLVGEDPIRFAKYHESTKNRIKAFSFAIVIPVLLWALTGYVIAANIFNFEPYGSMGIGASCAAFIYMIERIVLVTPKNWGTNFVRLVIGLIIAILGSTTFDLVLFDKEINTQIAQAEMVRISADFNKERAVYIEEINQKKKEWLSAQDAANCEANGTCGSKSRSVGPIYRKLATQAELLRQDYLSMQGRLDHLTAEKEIELASSPTVIAKQAGILARIEALHQYIHKNIYALIAYVLFFSLILFFELMVVITKIVFKETVDDQLNAYKEIIAAHQAKKYTDEQMSPAYLANIMLTDHYLCQ